MKKYLSLALALVLALSMTSLVAFAAEDEADGDASIGIIKGDITIIPDPDPDDPDFGAYGLVGLDFGRHISKSANAGDTFNSQIWAGQEEQEDGTLVEYDANAPKVSGLLVDNGQFEGWRATAQITGFFGVDGGGNMDTSKPTMDGFTLKLNKQNEYNSVPDAPKRAPDVSLSAGANGALGAPVRLMYAEEGDSIGVFGTLYDGDLTILPGTVKVEGDAKAVMTWAVDVGPDMP